MAQPNIQADGVRIEPGSGDTLTITRDPLTGSLRFVDAVVTAGINLRDMASLSTVAGVLVVGKSGAGATYTTVQSAITAVPADASLTNPYLVLILPGVYSENVVIEKAGITVLGLGRVVITAAGATPTITVQSSVSTTPTSLILKDLTVVQPNGGQACVSLIGAASSTIGRDKVLLDGCTLTASGVGSFTMLANAVNYISLHNCQSYGSSGTSSLRVSQCAELDINGGVLGSLQADYTTGGVIPFVTGSLYAVVNCVLGNVQSTLTGGGVLGLAGCASVGDITMYGNQTLEVSGSIVGNLSLNGSTAATLRFSSRGSVSGTGTLSEPVTTGSVPFVGSASEAVLFPVPRASGTYGVSLDTGVSTAAYVSARSATGFTVTFTSPVTTTVYWTVTQ
jgi:hypothetical protein